MFIRLFKLIKYLEDYQIIGITTQKMTARAPFSLMAKKGGKKYLIVVGTSKVQKFYIRRSIQLQSESKAHYEKYFQLNLPVSVNEKFGCLYVIYSFIENLSSVDSEYPIEAFDDLFSKQPTILVDRENINMIKDSFLAAWPQKYHKRIEKLLLYNTYFESLVGSSVKLFYEHGDFNIENVKTDGSQYYLFDYEFMKNNQPFQLDKYEYLSSLGVNEDENVLGKMKSRLSDEINSMVDGKKYIIIRPLQKFLIEKIIRITNRYVL